MKIKLFAGLLASLLATVALGQTYSIFSPGPSGPVKSNGTYALQSEVSADIIGLWTGTCSATTFLKGAGACGQVALTTDVSGVLPVPNGGLGVGTITGLVLGNGTSPVSAYGGNGCTNQFIRSLSAAGVATCNSVALATDVTGNLSVNNLNSGTGASATTYWTGNGTWTSLGGLTGLANPSGLIGLTAVNGTATTATRSDATHALDQSIAPTWTSLHTFGAARSWAAQRSGVTSTLWYDMAATADQGKWEVASGTNVWILRTQNDAESVARNAINVDRGTGAAVADILFGNATDNPSYTYLGTGRASFGGAYGGGTTPAVGLTTSSSGFYGIFDGTHESLFGTFTSGGFVGTFSNHEFDIRTNNAARITISTAGAVTINQPTSSSALIATGAGSNPVIQVTPGASGATAPGGIQVNAPASGVGPSLFSQSGQIGLAMNSGGTNYGFIQNNGSNQWCLSTGTSLNALGLNSLCWYADQGATIGSGTDQGAGTLSVSTQYYRANLPVVPVVALMSCTAGGCTTLRGTGVSGAASRSGPGQYTLTYSTTFPSQPACVVTPAVATAAYAVANPGNSSTTVNTFNSAGTLTDMAWSIICS